MNRNLRKHVKKSGHFPSDDAAMKLLYLGIRNIEGRHIDGDGKIPTGRVRGTGTLGWTRAMNQFKIRFGDRLPL
jgi:putative transposase